jgi:hypothetical protein
MKKSNAKYFFGSLIVLGGLYASTSALAEGTASATGNDILDQCQYLTLATNLTMPKKFGTKNTSVCVDIPVNLEKVKIVFNMDTDSVDGKGNANGLKHMMMLGNVMKDKIQHGLIKPEDVSIIGIMHGSALKWATKAAPKQEKELMNAIFKLKKEGVNIQLETCAVTMNGAGLTKKNLYTYDAEGKPDPKALGRIYVNQGAFGRELYLQNHGYAYVEEGYDYHGKK